jgi:hypothetical protein
MQHIGQRVMFCSLMTPGDWPGEIVEVGQRPFGNGLVTVKLDRQERPVSMVLYYDHKPTVVNSSLWQICWPVGGDA